METGNDTRTENTALMKFNQVYFGYIFWSIFVVVMVSDFIVKGNETMDKMMRVKGIVVDQVRVSTGRRSEAYRPQVSYPVGDSNYLFVDHNTSLGIGAKPTILYWKDEPENARVYTFWFWIRFEDLVPSLIFSVLVYKIIIILTTRFRQKTVILPGNTPL